ncbi:MAG: outer membrane protein assembly factor BamD, partial [Acidobacteriaceae bacterium]
ESEAEEGSRMNVRLKDRALLLIKQGPSTIQAARVGDPTLKDPPPTLAPQIDQENVNLYKAAFQGKPLPGLTPAGTDKTAVAISQGEAPPAATNPQPLHLETIPDASGSAGSTVTVEIPSGTSASAGSGTTAPAGSGGGSSAGATATILAAPNSATPAAPNSAAPAANSEPLIKGVGPTNNQPLPPVDKPAVAANQINDVKGGAPAQIQTGTTAKKKKNKKAPYDSKDESSSRHKQKKGLKKLNPF